MKLNQENINEIHDIVVNNHFKMYHQQARNVNYSKGKWIYRFHQRRLCINFTQLDTLYSTLHHRSLFIP